MSDLVFNLMVFGWHFQITRRGRPSVTYNAMHRERGFDGGRVHIFQLGSWYRPMGA